MAKREIDVKPEWWDAEIETAVEAGPSKCPWAPWEEEMLDKLFGTMDFREVSRHLSRKRAERGLAPRSRTSVRNKAQTMGLMGRGK